MVIADHSARGSSSSCPSPGPHSTLPRPLSDCSGLSRSGYSATTRSSPTRYPSTPFPIYSLAPIDLSPSVLTHYNRSCTPFGEGFCTTVCSCSNHLCLNKDSSRMRLTGSRHLRGAGCPIPMSVARSRLVVPRATVFPRISVG